MGKDPDREPPFFFMKPADAVVDATGVIPFPPLTSAFHHEIELVVALKAGGSNVTPDAAPDLVWGYGVGVDLTRRDIQDEAKKLSRPWDWAKSFDASAPCSPLHSVSEIGHPVAGEIWLSVNGEIKQRGDLRDLIWSVPEVISCLAGGKPRAGRSHLQRNARRRRTDATRRRHQWRCRRCRRISFLDRCPEMFSLTR